MLHPDPVWNSIGALIVRIGFGVYYTIIIIRSPQNPILIIEAPILHPCRLQMTLAVEFWESELAKVALREFEGCLYTNVLESSPPLLFFLSIVILAVSTRSV